MSPQAKAAPIPGRCCFCNRSIMWQRGTPLCCDDCIPRYEAEAKEMLRCVGRYRAKAAREGKETA